MGSTVIQVACGRWVYHTCLCYVDTQVLSWVRTYCIHVHVCTCKYVNPILNIHVHVHVIPESNCHTFCIGELKLRDNVKQKHNTCTYMYSVCMCIIYMYIIIHVQCMQYMCYMDMQVPYSSCGPVIRESVWIWSGHQWTIGYRVHEEHPCAHTGTRTLDKQRKAAAGFGGVPNGHWWRHLTWGGSEGGVCWGRSVLCQLSDTWTRGKRNSILCDVQSSDLVIHIVLHVYSFWNPNWGLLWQHRYNIDVCFIHEDV